MLLNVLASAVIILPLRTLHNSELICATARDGKEIAWDVVELSSFSSYYPSFAYFTQQ
jgi:hypothetical protein